MSTLTAEEELIAHLTRLTGLPEAAAARLVAEVLHHYSESVEEFVRRRHRELQARGLTNRVIFETVTEELGQRRFPAGSLTERQLRRIVYG